MSTNVKQTKALAGHGVDAFSLEGRAVCSVRTGLLMMLRESRVTTKRGASALLALLAVTSAPLTLAAFAEASPAHLASAHVAVSNEKRLIEAERSLLQALSGVTSEPLNAPKAEPKQASSLPRKEQSAVKGEPASAGAQKAREVSGAATKAADAEGTGQVKDSVNQLVTTVSALESSNQSLKQQLASAQARIGQLERQLDESRSQLSIAETEVTRLSSIIDSKTRASLGKYNVSMPPKPAQPAQVRPVARTLPVVPPVDVRPPSADADLQVATISVEKADLRLGPGRNHSALMSLKRGSRLMVEARQGEWYRVFAPNGDRAWISADLVTFGDPSSAAGDGSTVRVKGFSANAEEEAFRRVQRASGSN